MAATIPQVQTPDRNSGLYQTQLAKTLTPLTQCPIPYGMVVQSITTDANGNRVTSNFITLTTGANVVQHQLNRKPQGYFIVRQKAAANIYDTWDAQIPDSQPLDKIVTFNSSADVVVSIWLF